MVYDVLILGRGIAGAVLAEACRLRGLSAQVFDQRLDGSATWAAGGAVNPVVFRRDTLCWGAERFMPAAKAFYNRWEAHLGLSCWHDEPLVKLFTGPQEAALWEQALRKPGMAPFLASRPEPEIDAGPFRAPHGYGTVTYAGRLDIPRLLDAQRTQLLADGTLHEKMMDPEEVRHEGGLVAIGEVKGRWLVDCSGPFHASQGLVPVKGETLTVHIPGLRLTRMVYGAIGLLAAGDGVFRVGSTFKWTDVWEGPTAQARDWMLERLSEMLEAHVEPVEAHAGVRPAARDRKPILGMVGKGIAVFNGLGARGVMQAPWCAGHLLDHLFEGKPLDAEVDAARYA